MLKIPILVKHITRKIDGAYMVFWIRWMIKVVKKSQWRQILWHREYYSTLYNFLLWCFNFPRYSSVVDLFSILDLTFMGKMLLWYVTARNKLIFLDVLTCLLGGFIYHLRSTMCWLICDNFVCNCSLSLMRYHRFSHSASIPTFSLQRLSISICLK